MKHKKLTNLVLISGFVFCLLALACLPVRQAACVLALEESNPSSAALINKAWEAHGKKDIESTFKYTQQVIDLYKDEADKIQASLTALPNGKDEIEQAEELNNVATACFIQAESLMLQGKVEEAKKVFQLIIDRYPYAQAWDQRGWYWQIAEISKKSIKKMETGSIEIEQEKKKVSQLATGIKLYDAGKEEFVDYVKYGEFTNVGTRDYKYIVRDQEGLISAVGEGIYPNAGSVKWDPAYSKALKEKRLEGSHWDFMHSPDLEAAFLRWATAPEPQGIKMFYEGLILEKAGLIKHAIKCYYAIVVHYPGSYGITYFKTPWYVGQAALAKIQFLLARNPQLGYKLEGAEIRIVNGFDKEVHNDIVITNPGRFVKSGILTKLKPRPSADTLSIKRRLGKGKVHLVQYENGDWQLIVAGKPYTIKGITYAPTKVGESPDDGTISNWMCADLNQNDKIDGPYDSFVDKNRNNRQDAFEPVVGDFSLMKEMGVNTIRVYHQPMPVNKQLLRELYERYGIRVIMGDFLGKYALGSGAAWSPGTDYNNDEHKRNMMQSVTKMVMEFKDEPYVLFWLLGNENVYGYACNADKDPEAFFKFASEVARQIKSIDPEHPVGICNGDVLYLDKFGKYAPDIDIFGVNAYRGDYGFGSLWAQVAQEADRPAFITEFGCPAYSDGKTVYESETAQAEYHRGSWENIKNNMAFAEGRGTALGGVVFEWLDEWWKGYEPAIHDTKGTWIGPFPDGTMHEEWLGVCGQGDGKSSPLLRQLRQSYYMYKKLWKQN
jgi:hypothetical protein